MHESEGIYAAAGGTASGFIVEYQDGVWTNVTPDPAPDDLSGVALGKVGFGIAVGNFGGVYSRSADAGWVEEPIGFSPRQGSRRVNPRRGSTALIFLLTMLR